VLAEDYFLSSVHVLGYHVVELNGEAMGGDASRVLQAQHFGRSVEQGVSYRVCLNVGRKVLTILLFQFDLELALDFSLCLPIICLSRPKFHAIVEFSLGFEV
jgi:hypothetical protein